MDFLVPPPRINGSSLTLDETRTISRADSVLDYYASASASRDLSPERQSRTSFDHPSSLRGSKNAHLRRSQLSDNGLYDEFGFDSRYQAIVDGKHQESSTAIAAPMPLRPTNGGTLQTTSNVGESESETFRRVYSLSRIPVPRDRCSNNSIAGEATRVPFQAKPNSAAVTDPTQNDNHSTIRMRTVPKSESMPLDQLPFKTRTSFESSDANTFGSLPSRKSQTHDISGMRRSISLSGPARQKAFKDHRALREEQARRVQLINTAPSGPPPWLGKFQPDPRLPADQQMLPTVARKLALERWRQDGFAEESFDDMWETHKTWTSPIAKRSSMYDPPYLLTTTREEPRDDDQSSSVPSNSSPRPLYTPPKNVPPKSPVLGQNPGSSLHRQTSSFGTNMPNFSRRSVHNMGSPQLTIGTPAGDSHSRTNSSGLVPYQRLTDTTDSLAIADLPHTQNRPKTTDEGGRGLGLVIPSTPRASENVEETINSVPTPSKVVPARIGHDLSAGTAATPKAHEQELIKRRGQGSRSKKDFDDIIERDAQKKARCCIVM